MEKPVQDLHDACIEVATEVLDKENDMHAITANKKDKELYVIVRDTLISRGHNARLVADHYFGIWYVTMQKKSERIRYLNGELY